MGVPWGTGAPAGSGPFPAVSPREMRLFKDVVKIIRPRIIVEFGSWEGASAIAWALACQAENIEPRVICIDTWLGSPEHWANSQPSTEWEQARLRVSQGEPQLIDTFRNTVNRFGLAKCISPLRATTEGGTLYLHSLNVLADCVYVDADHSYNGALNDLDRARSLVSQSGVIAIDDWGHGPVRRAVLRFTIGSGLEVLALEQENSALLIGNQESLVIEKFISRGYRRVKPGLEIVRSAKNKVRRRFISGNEL